MDELLKSIRDCKVCEANLPMGANPILTAHKDSKIIIIGQAPGKKVHETSIPWNDKSGDNLRSWLGIDKDIFYDAQKIVLIPMGFCYPGTHLSKIKITPDFEIRGNSHILRLRKLNRHGLDKYHTFFSNPS
jgi:uracil-DNA glycosylase